MGAYRELFDLPAAKRLALVSALGRIGNGWFLAALSLGPVVAGASLTSAALMGAAWGVVHALAAPWQSRLLRRYPLRQLTRRLCAGFALTAGLLCAVMAATQQQPLWWVLPAMASAVFSPALSSSTREIWWRMAQSEQLRRTASGWEAAATPAAFSIAPALGLAACALLPLWVAVAIGALLTLAGAMGVASHPQASASPQLGQEHTPGIPGPMRRLLLTYSCYHASRAALDLSMVALAVAGGYAALGGLLVGLPSMAAAVGGLWVGSRSERWPSLPRMILLSLLAQAAAIALILLGQAWWWLLVAGVLAGLAKCATPPAVHHLAAHSMGGRAAEASALAGATIVAGGAVGRLVGGPVGDGLGPVVLVGCACAWLLVGALLSLRLRAPHSAAVDG